MSSNTESTALFKVPTLTGLDDFFQWKSALTDSLLMLGALDIVEGTEPQPVAIKIEDGGSTEDKKDFKSWVERDRKAMAIMRRTISDALKVDIEDCRSAKEIWDRLGGLHDLTAPEHRAEVKRELLNHFLLEGTDLKTHLEGFLELLLKASGAGIRYSDEDKSLMFLDTLQASFDMLKFQWRMMPVHQKTFVELRRQYNLEGAQRARTQARSTAAVMMAAKNGVNKPFHNNNSKFRQATHPERKSSEHGNGKKQERDTSRMRCFRCKELGHMKRDCPQREHNGQRRTQDTYQGHTHLVAPTGPFIGLSCGVTVDPAEEATVATVVAQENTVWIIDSGATHHIVSDMSILTATRELHSPLQFGLATREGSMTSNVSGSVDIKTRDGKNIILTDVHHVGEARVNLLSAPVLIRKGWTVSLKHKESFLRNGELTLPVEERQGLFYIKLPVADVEMQDHQAVIALTQAEKRAASLTEWHERLGHISMTFIKNMARNGTIQGLEVGQGIVNSFCSTCQKAKSSKSSFNQTTLRGTSPLDLVMSDVAGPFQESASGNKYYATLIDDFLGLTLAKGVPAKSMVAQTLIGWINLLENLLATKVHVLRTDGGGEYTSKAFESWLAGKGIVHQITPPYTPQHNGIAERKNRTIKEMVSAMMIDSGIPSAYWDWAVQYSIIIQLTLTVRDGVSGWERLYKRKPDLAKLQPFGCNVWVHSAAETRVKSDFTTPKSFRGLYLGLTFEGGAAVLVKETGRIIVSREVTFEPKNESARITELEHTIHTRLAAVPGTRNTNQVDVDEAHLKSSIEDAEEVEGTVSGGGKDQAERGGEEGRGSQESEVVAVDEVEAREEPVMEDQGEQEVGDGQQGAPGQAQPEDKDAPVPPAVPQGAGTKRAREDEVGDGAGGNRKGRPFPHRQQYQALIDPMRNQRMSTGT
ncbi:unnamed protein product [Tilletia controversa]|nr:unnamed protein product [Tilletia controversa]